MDDQNHAEHKHAEVIRKAIRINLAETFDTGHGIFLDKGDQLWTKLEKVTAEQASVRIAPGGNSIAGQIAHMIYYLEITMMYWRNSPPEKADWDAAWQLVEVNEEQWKELKMALAQRQDEILTLLNGSPDDVFGDADNVGDAIAMVAHNAFHLGQILHALAAQGHE